MSSSRTGFFCALPRRIGQVVTMEAGDRALLLEAAVALSVAQLLVLTTPFRRIARWLESDRGTHDCDENFFIRLGSALGTAGRGLPWRIVCLPEAIAAKAMLRRRGYRSALHIGASVDSNGKLVAHAWVVTGGKAVVGGSDVRHVMPLARFG